jgi:NitT/TauT family transport system permease protein
MFVLSLLLVAAAWELYRVVGPDGGGTILGAQVLPKSNDRVMPSISLMAERMFDPVQAGGESTWWFLAKAVWYSLRLSLGGFAIGSMLGVGLAVLMTRFRFAERGVLPYLVVSQTVPLIALAPLVVSWGGKLSLFGWEWQPWMSVVVLGAFLSFFPIAVGTLRGLKSPPPEALELMSSLAAPWRRTLTTLRFPAAMPYIIPSLRLGAAGSVIGVVVSEISTGLRGGVGRPIIEYARQTTADPAKVYCALVAAAVLGLVMAGLVGGLDMFVMRNRPKEQPA